MGKSDIFEDVVICLTGAMSMTRNELTSLIKKNGGTVSSSVTRKTTHLVSAQGEAGTEKYSKAEDEGLPIVSEDWIHDSVEEGVLKDVADYALGDAPSSPKKKAPAKKAPTKKATTKRKRDEDDEEEEEDEEEDEEKEVPDTKEKPAKMQKVMMKGRAPVDEDSGYVMSGQIFCDADIWSATLNQTDVKAGVLGHNKFYKIQLIDTGGKYVVFTKWGRVGAKGQKATEACGSSIEKAKSVFCKKFKEKTKNEWSNRANFKAQKGKYTLVDVNYGDEDEEEEEEEEEEEKKPKKEGVSKLDKKVQSLMQLISNKSLMVDTMKLFEIDLKKMPLGKLSKKQLQNGYSVLKRIQAVLDGEEDDEDDVDDLSSQFYSLIPHDFGRQRPPSIDTKVKLEKKLDMMNALDDMEVASKLLAGAEKSSEHPIDAAYHSLKTELVPLDHNSDTFKMILEYIQNSHAPTHSGYTLELEDVFEVKREGEKERFTADMGNHRLLWHGSRITNFMGILSTGLRIAPPEAPVTGYMFGKGVYFADSVSKSANYCFANHSNNNGILLLSDVALGNMRERYQADFVSDLPNDRHQSTFGVGKMAPDPKGNKTIDNNITVPMGKLIPQQGFTKPLSLQYNEFIVYDVKQINIRYLLKTKFHYK